MNLLLLLPAALGALLALAIPLLIHLARRDQQQPTVFAALRWLREKPKPRRRIRFDEWPLLFLRLLLLALLALWLARPVLTGTPDTTPWTVIAPGVPDGEVQRLRHAGRGELRWLAAGFPPLSAPMPAEPQPTASLLRQLDAEVPREAALSVVVPERLSGVDGAPVVLSRDIEWRVLSGASPQPDADAPATRLPLVVRHGEGQEASVRILRAATRALRGDDDGDGDASLFDASPVGTALPAGTRRIAWLAPGELPAGVRRWIESGGDALLAVEVEVDWPEQGTLVPWRDGAGAPLVEMAPMGEGRMLRFTRPLQPAAMPQLLEPDFPARLQALFDVPAAPTRALAEAAAPRTGGEAWPPPPRALQPWLALLIALLVVIERWLAASPRRQVRT